MKYNYVILLTASLFVASPAFAVILHPDAEPPMYWNDRPSDNVIGRWGSNGSCVAIAPDLVLTTRHQGGGIGTTVDIAGDSYTVSQVWYHSSADIRVAKLDGANLTEYANLYTGDDEVGKNFVVGGFGRCRGEELLTGGGIVYGYEWAGDDNQTLRWGTNIVDGIIAKSSRGYVSSVLQADFDGLDTGTEYEAAPAEWDSGGGWFVKIGDEWQLVALNAYVEQEGQTCFKSPSGALDPDLFWGIRISEYSDWVNSIVPEPATLLLLTIGALGVIHRRR